MKKEIEYYLEKNGYDKIRIVRNEKHIASGYDKTVGIRGGEYKSYYQENTGPEQTIYLTGDIPYNSSPVTYKTPVTVYFDDENSALEKMNEWKERLEQEELHREKENTWERI